MLSRTVNIKHLESSEWKLRRLRINTGFRDDTNDLSIPTLFMELGFSLDIFHNGISL